MSKNTVPLIRPPLRFSDIENDFRSILDSGMLTRGSYVEKFKAEIASYTQSKYAHLATSATTALSACLRVLGVGPGDEVGVADFSFPATSNIVEEVGAKPVFIDVSLDTYNIPLENLQNSITPKMKAVIFVSCFGNPSGIHRVYDYCKSRNIPLIDDAACALGSSEKGIASGKLADLSCFSFHPRKVITTGEGGAVTTENKEYSDVLARMLNHGAEPDTSAGWKFTDWGTNFRMSELQAAMGVFQIKKIKQILDARLKLRDQYISALEPLGLIPQKIFPDAKTNAQSIVFKAESEKTRNELINHLKSLEIESTLGTYSLSSTPYNMKKYGRPLPNSSKLQRETITLPCFEGMPIDRVLSAIQSFF